MTQEKTCKGCIYSPISGGTYPVECCACSRWYADKYVSVLLIIENKLKEIRTLQDRMAKLIDDVEKLEKNND